MQQKDFKIQWLLLGSLICSIGASFIWSLTTIYVHDYLHMPLTVAASVIFLNCMSSLVGNTVGGYLFDHWQPDLTLLTAIGIDVVGAGSLIFFHGWPVYALLLMVMGLGSGMTYTTINSYGTRIPGRNASYAFNFLYFANSLGVVGGTLVVGYVLAAGIQYIFACAALMYALLGVVVFIFYRGKRLRQDSTEKIVEKKGAKHGRIRPEVLTILLTIFIVWCFYEQWATNLSAYMISLHLSVKAYSSVWTINAGVIILIQPLLTRHDTWLTQHLTWRLFTGLTLLAASFVVLLNAHTYPMFAAAMVVLSLGEVTTMPAVSTYINFFATTATRGHYQGLVQAASSFGRAIGPLTGAVIIEHSSYHSLFIVAMVCLALVCIMFTSMNFRRKYVV